MARGDYIGLAVQSAFGTPNTTWAFFPQVKSCDLDASQELMETEETSGSYEPEDLDYGTRSVENGIEVNARPDSLGAFLSMCFGAPETTEVVAGEVYSHVWQMDGTPIPWTVLKVNADPATDIGRYFADVYGDTFSYTIAPNDYLQCTVGCMGTDVVRDASGAVLDASGTVVRDTSPKFHFVHAAIEIGTYGEAYAAQATGSLTANHTNSLDGDNYKLGSRTRYAIDPANRDAELTALILGEEATYYKENLADTATFRKIKMTATGEVFHLTNAYSLTIEYPRVQTTSAPANINASERMKGIEVGFRAAADGLGTITLVNANDGTDYAPAA